MSKKELMKRMGICIGVIAVAAVSLGAVEDEGEMVTEVYTVKRHDTVWSIAEKHLPEGKYILQFQHEILEANPEVRANGCVIHPGDKLKISYRVK